MSTVLWVCEFIHSSDCTFLYLILSNTFSLTDELTNLHNFFFERDLELKSSYVLNNNDFNHVCLFNSSHHAWEFLKNLSTKILRLMIDWLTWMMNFSNNNNNLQKNDALILLLLLIPSYSVLYIVNAILSKKKIIIMHKSKF